MSVFSQIDALVAGRSLLRHPFYLRWSEGKLTKDELKVYAKEYFHLVKAVPGIVEGIAAKTGAAAARDAIERNVHEETEHIALWERFAFALGISAEELRAHVPSAMTREAVRQLEEAAGRGWEEGIAAVYALECELAKIAQTKKQGLLEFYGLGSDDAQAYFDEHLQEESHLQTWRAHSLDTSVLASAEASLSAQHRVLDAVCAEAGIPLHC